MGPKIPSGGNEYHETTPLLSLVEGSSDFEAKSTKKIKLLSCVSMMLSMMIGVGIFIFPSLVIREVNSGGAALTLWGVAGFVVLISGLCYAELASSYPGTGGEFVYLEKVYGRSLANLFLITCSVVKYPAISAIVAQSCLRYLTEGISQRIVLSNPTTSVFSVIIIASACILVATGTRFSTNVINILNSCKLVGLLALISFGAFATIKAPDKSVIAERFSFSNTTSEPTTFFVAFFGAISSYDGWNALNMVAGEVDNPQRTIPLAMTIATVLASILYVSASAAYIAILPVEVMKNSKAIALDLGYMALGRYGKIFLTICVDASALATVIAVSICNSRLLQKAATQGQIPDVIKLTHRKTQTPIFAIILHFVLSCFYTTQTSLEFLATMMVVLAWVFYMLCFVGVVITRYRAIVNSRFKVPLILPLILVCFCLLLIFSPVTREGAYRNSFILATSFLLVLTPITFLTTWPSFRLPGSQRLHHFSDILTKWIVDHFNFE